MVRNVSRQSGAAMERKFGAGAVAFLAAVATGTTAFAASKCAMPVEVTAIQAAAVQQELMVAALTCNEVPHFNAFQTSFGKELRSADKRLLSMFRRLYGMRRGEAEYHAFKTRLANDSSIRSIHDNLSYCREAQQVFAAALGPDKPVLANFVSGVAVHEEGPVDSCDVRVALGLKGTASGFNVVPKPNPLRVAALASPQAASNVPAATPAPVTAAPPAATQLSAAAKPSPVQKNHSGWFSGVFN